MIASPVPLDRVSHINSQILGCKFLSALPDLDLESGCLGGQQRKGRGAADNKCDFKVNFHCRIVAICVSTVKQKMSNPRIGTLARKGWTGQNLALRLQNEIRGLA